MTIKTILYNITVDKHSDQFTVYRVIQMQIQSAYAIVEE